MRLDHLLSREPARVWGVVRAVVVGAGLVVHVGWVLGGRAVGFTVNTCWLCPPVCGGWPASARVCVWVGVWWVVCVLHSGVSIL